MTTASASGTGRRASRRRLLVVAAGLLVLVVATYFVVTSSAFFKGVILPQVSRAIHGQVTVADASIRPFSQVRLRQLRIQTTGAEPLVQVEEVRLRYRLFAILRGTLAVDEVTLDSPIVRIIQSADGRSNLDPLLQGEAAPGPAPTSAPSRPPQLRLKNLALNNAVLRLVKQHQDSGSEIAELSGVNITLDQLENGQQGKLRSTATFRLSRPTNDVLEATSSGSVDFTLGTDLMPQTLRADVQHEIRRAEGSLRDLAGLRAVLTGDLTPGEVKAVSQRFLRGDRLLGEVKVSGPLDLSKKEGRLRLEVTSIDRQVLNLLGAPFGLDFGPTTLDSTTELSLSQGGAVLAANTQGRAGKFSLAHNGQTTPPLDVQWACSVTVNTASESAQVQTLTLDGAINQHPLLSARLARPMTLAWGKNTSASGDSAFELAIKDFDLAPWKPFLGDAVSAGRLAMQLNLLSAPGGRQFQFDVGARIAELAIRWGETPLSQAELQLKLNGQVSDFAKVRLNDYRLDVTRHAQPALTVAGAASYDGAAFNLQTHLEAVMARLVGSGPATPLALDVQLDGSYTNAVLDLHRLQLALTPTARAPKNELQVVGRFDLSLPATTRGQVTAKADTLDLTPLYDAFARETRPSSTPAPATPATPAGGNAEPEPVTLPLQLAAEATFNQVYLREIHLQQGHVTAKVEPSRVRVDPCRLSLNGAPVQAAADLDLGVRGYAYTLSLQLDQVPLEPIANTFAPASRGQYQGLILARTQIQGTGVTGAAMQKHLTGQAAFSFTNANIQLLGPKTRKLVVPIATLLRIDAITKSPLNWLDAQTDLGGGNIKLNRFAVQSGAFEATTQGVIPIAEVLTNSPLNLPITFALRRSLAQASSLLPPNTPPDAAYAVLPQFVTVKGTLGEPTSDLNERALAGLLLQSGVGVAQKLGVDTSGKVGSLLQGAGNLLTGQKSASTNPPSTNPAPKLKPLDLLRRK